MWFIGSGLSLFSGALHYQVGFMFGKYMYNAYQVFSTKYICNPSILYVKKGKVNTGETNLEITVHIGISFITSLMACCRLVVSL